MKKILFVLLAFVLFSSVALAENTNNYCFNSTVLSTTSAKTILADNSSTEIITSENITCQDGCSSTLSACRWNGGDQAFWGFGLVVFFILVIVVAGLVSTQLKYLDLAILFFIVVFDLILSVGLDLFTGTVKTILIFFVIIPIAVAFYSLLKGGSK